MPAVQAASNPAASYAAGKSHRETPQLAASSKFCNRFILSSYGMAEQVVAARQRHTPAPKGWRIRRSSGWGIETCGRQIPCAKHLQYTSPRPCSFSFDPAPHSHLGSLLGRSPVPFPARLLLPSHAHGRRDNRPAAPPPTSLHPPRFQLPPASLPASGHPHSHHRAHLPARRSLPAAAQLWVRATRPPLPPTPYPSTG